jgi:hypothetical protein
MSQNITDFYTQAQKRDFARQFQFRVTQLGTTNLGEDSFVYIETASVPGRQINNQPVPFMGLTFNVPGTASYPSSENWPVTFRCDQNYNIRSVLESMTFQTFDDQTSTGNYNTPGPASVINLNLLGKRMETIRQYKLIGAYVVSIPNMQYNLGDNGQIVTFEATLAYQYWLNAGVTTR